MTSLLERFGRWNLRLMGARGRFQHVDGTRLHYWEVAGSGTHGDLVLLHGIGSGATTFAPLIRRLKPHFSRLILPEAPAHGLSEASPETLTLERVYRLTAGLLDTVLGSQRFGLYGNSLGGGAALRYASERPGSVSHLVLLSPAGARTDSAGLASLVKRFRFDSRREAAAFVRRLFHKPRWYFNLAVPHLRRRLARPAVRGLLEHARVDDQLDGKTVSGLAMPTLFMWGGAERILPASHLAWFRRHLPGHVRIETPRHFGHSAYIEFPAQVAAKIVALYRDTLRSTDPDETPSGS